MIDPRPKRNIAAPARVSTVSPRKGCSQPSGRSPVCLNLATPPRRTSTRLIRFLSIKPPCLANLLMRRASTRHPLSFVRATRTKPVQIHPRTITIRKTAMPLASDRFSMSRLSVHCLENSCEGSFARRTYHSGSIPKTLSVNSTLHHRPMCLEQRKAQRAPRLWRNTRASSCLWPTWSITVSLQR